MRDGDRCVISVVHDLSLALCYGTRVLLLDRGCLTADGPARDTLASDALRRAYGMDVADWMAQTAEQMCIRDRDRPPPPDTPAERASGPARRSCRCCRG